MSLAPSSSLPSVLGLLDVGTAKVVCLMLARDAAGIHRLVGVGHQLSHGLKAGVITDPAAAEDAVRAAVAQAEHMAGATLDAVVLAAACGRMNSVHLSAGIELADGCVTPTAVDRLVTAGRRHAERGDHCALHTNIISARLDGTLAAKPAIGAAGRHLAIDLHAVVVDRAPLRHLQHVVDRCQLRILAMAPTPLAAALAVTTAAERRRGVLVIDFGAGTTGVALFVDGLLLATHVLPIGGHHLTYDLSRSLAVSVEEAERIKQNYAIVSFAPVLHDAALSQRVAAIDHASTMPVQTHQVSGAPISKIIATRISALLTQIRQRLEPLGVASDRYGEAVLTGGGSALAGLAAQTAEALGVPVRIATSLTQTVLPEALRRPGFAAVSGLEAILTSTDLGLRPTAPPASVELGHDSPLARIGF